MDSLDHNNWVILCRICTKMANLMMGLVVLDPAACTIYAHVAFMVQGFSDFLGPNVSIPCPKNITLMHNHNPTVDVLKINGYQCNARKQQSTVKKSSPPLKRVEYRIRTF